MLSAPPSDLHVLNTRLHSFAKHTYLSGETNQFICKNNQKRLLKSGVGWARGRLWWFLNGHKLPCRPRFFSPQKHWKPVGAIATSAPSPWHFRLQWPTPNFIDKYRRTVPQCHIIQLMNFRQTSSYIHPTGHLKSSSQKSKSPNFSLQLRRDLLWEFILHCSKPSSGLQVFFSSHTQWQLNSNECVTVKPPEGKKRMVKIPSLFLPKWGQKEIYKRHVAAKRVKFFPKKPDTFPSLWMFVSVEIKISCPETRKTRVNLSPWLSQAVQGFLCACVARMILPDAWWFPWAVQMLFSLSKKRLLQWWVHTSNYHSSVGQLGAFGRWQLWTERIL